jgi:putative SOS response-associated peptidase YedK
MCGRFSLGASAMTLATQFDLANLPAWSPRYNITPTQEVLAVLKTRESSSRRPRLLRWGLVPPWAEDPHIGNRLINARAETVATKPAFRRAFRECRCLILANGFYEWQRQGRHKRPFHIRMSDGRPFAFAGLWDQWEDPEGPPIDSCTIITTVANDLIRPLHARMPVILAPEDYDLWLEPAVQEVQRIQSLLRPYPAEEMTAYPVSTRVNNPANDSPECLEPVA